MSPGVTLNTIVGFPTDACIDPLALVAELEQSGLGSVVLSNQPEAKFSVIV